MKKLTTSLIIFGILTLSAFAAGVNQSELETTGSTQIQFENYTGPHSVIETVEAIRGIGTNLGKQVAVKPDESGVFDKNAKYSVIHIVDPADKTKLDADILVINENATVDHITNLRRIIAAYLSAAYGYSERDASTLATFVTVYNAVYRQNLNAFSQKYKDKVVSELTQDKCGLSTKWNEWPGKSQIVIPLNDVTAGISTVDTSVISDKNVISNMQEDDGKNIDDRKQMVDIKEREAEQASQSAQESAKEAADAKQQLDTEKDKLQQAQQQQQEAQQKADEAQKQADQAKQEAQANPGNAQAQQKADEAQKQADQAKQEADKATQNVQQQQEKTEQAQQVVDEKRQEAQNDQAFADKKQNEAQSERQEISKDQQQVIREEAAMAKTPTVIGLRIVNTSNSLSAMVKMNAETGAVMKQSPVTVIRGRTILYVGSQDFDGEKKDAYMAICGENSKNGAVKLCLIDTETMEIQKESTETIAEDSVLVQNGSDYYCIIKDGSNFYLGKFDSQLNLKLRSTVALMSSTPVTVTSSGIAVTQANGQIILLKEGTLQPVGNSERPER